MSCGTCTLIQRRDRGEAPLWDSIRRSEGWDVVHAYDTSMPGWLVLVTRRHLESLDELTEAEAVELGSLISNVSGFLKEETGCAKTYVMQFAEHPEHPHVHFHVVPRPIDLAPEHKGPGIFHYLGVSDEVRVSEPDMDKLGVRLRAWLERTMPSD